MKKVPGSVREAQEGQHSSCARGPRRLPTHGKLQEGPSVSSLCSARLEQTGGVLLGLGRWPTRKDQALADQ